MFTSFTPGFYDSVSYEMGSFGSEMESISLYLNLKLVPSDRGDIYEEY